MFQLCKNIKFEKQDSAFQSKLENSIKSIKQKGKVIVKADKMIFFTQWMRITTKNYCLKMLLQNTKKATTEVVNNINAEAELLISKNKIKGKIKKIFLIQT